MSKGRTGAPALDVRYHADFGQYFLFLRAGRSEIDGEPLYYALLLTDQESQLWQRGEKEELAKRLRERGVPLPRPCGLREGKFRKFLRGLRESFSRLRKGKE